MVNVYNEMYENFEINEVVEMKWGCDCVNLIVEGKLEKFIKLGVMDFLIDELLCFKVM